MSEPNDHGMFPQSLLRFVAACQKLGVPEVEAVRIYLASFRLPDRHANALWRIEQRLVQGATLADELEARDDLFPRWMSSTVRWGQKTGKLDVALERAARLSDLDARIARAVTVVLAYPAFLTTVSLAIGAFFLMALAPSLTFMWAGRVASAPLPFDLQWPLLSRFSGALRQVVDWGPQIATVALLCWFWLLGTWALAAMPGHARLLDLIERCLPGARFVRRMGRGALQAHLLGEGIAAGMALDDTLERVAPLCVEPRLEAALLGTARAVRAGEPAGAALSRLAAGDEVGELLSLALASPDPSGSLESLSTTFEGAVRDRLPTLGRAVIPIVTIAVASGASLLPLWCFVELVRVLDYADLLLAR